MSGETLTVARNPDDGLIKTFCEVHCVSCEAPMLGLPHPLRRAAERLEAHGWRQIGRRWTCPQCRATLTPENSNDG